MENAKKRIGYIDIARGIAIILVVVGHACPKPLLYYIYQFHLPVFFFISGIMYKSYYEEHPVENFTKRLKAYYVPFLKYQLIFLVLHNVFCAWNLLNEFSGEAAYSKVYSLKDFIKYGVLTIGFVWRERFGGAMWYLICVFTISVAFPIIMYLVKKIKNRYVQVAIVPVIMIIFAIIGFNTSFISAAGYKNIGKVSVSMVGLQLYYLGVLYGNYREKIEQIPVWSKVVISALCAGIVLGMSKINPGGMAGLSYRYYWLFPVGAVAGIAMVMLVSQLPGIRSSKFLTLCGKYSLQIMCLHFLAFKIVTFIMIKWYNYPMEYLGYFPTYEKGLWWIAYSVVGVLVTLAFAWLTDIKRYKAKKK